MANVEEIYLRDTKHRKDFSIVDGDLETESGIENVENAIFRRIITEKGSIAHLPNYGIGIKSYQNAPTSLQNQRRLALDIEEQIPQDPRVIELLGVEIQTDDLKPEKLIIIARIDLVGLGEQTLTFIPFGV